MIFNELNTPFRWYAALNRQNRFKGFCESLCEFGLISTCDDILPFQIVTNTWNNTLKWNVISIEDETVINISTCVSFINKYTAPDGNIYLSYNGGSLAGCMPEQIPCGKWYSVIVDDNNNSFYSEVFEVKKIDNYSNIYEVSDKYLFTALRFYDSIDKQTRYKSYCESACNYYLKGSNTSLIPFMFRDEVIGEIQTFTLVGIDGCELIIPTIYIQVNTLEDYDYVYYNGDEISNLPCGKFYIRIEDDLGNSWYSELFELINVSSIGITEHLETDDGITIDTDDAIHLTVD